MTRAVSAWVGPERPTVEQFERLCMDAAVACARGARVFDISENSDFRRSQRLMIEDLTHTIEQVIDSARDLNNAITVCLSDALPIEQVVDAKVEGQPF